MRLAAAALALAAATPASADTLIDNVDGQTLAADGTLQRFTGMLIDDNGRVEQLFKRGERRPLRPDYRLDGKGRVLLPGLIDSHVELMELALSRIAPAAPGARPRPEDRDQALIEVQRILLERGITTVADMGATIEDWQTYRRAGDLGTLNLRILAYAASVDDLVLMAGPRPTPWLYDDRLRCHGLRIDFALPAAPRATARPGPRPPEPAIQLKNLLSRAGIDRFQAAVVLRDAAALPAVLDAVGELSQTYKGERRWRVEMAAMPAAEQVPRLAALGMAVSLQPQALAMPSAALPVSGPARVRVTYGSGAVAVPPEPLAALAAALRREDSLDAMGPGAAWAAFAEGRIGRIAVGQRADFILLDGDPLLASAGQLRTMRVLQTWVGGRLVYQAKDETAAVPKPPADR